MTDSKGSSDQLEHDEYGTEVRLAAYGLAVQQGYRCLAAPEPGSSTDDPLPPLAACAAADELAARLNAALYVGEQLPARYDAAATRAESQRLVCELLELRMDAWAAWQSLDDAYLACLADGGADASALDLALNAACEALESFDGVLQDEQELLSGAVATGRLDQWREGLGDLFRQSPPWWLDGRLERSAARVLDDAVATLSSAAAWRAIRDRMNPEVTLAVPEPPVIELRAPVEELTLSASREGPPPQNRPLRWVRPGSESPEVAQMLVPVEPPPTAGQRVRLSFFRGGQRAEQWIGQPVELSGIRRTVDERAGADFDYETLYQASRSPGGLVLRVGRDQETWRWDEA